MNLLIVITVSLMSLNAAAQSSAQISKPITSNTSSTTTENTSASKPSPLSISYFSFYDGPGLDPELRGATPNARGRYQEDGQSLFNIITFKYQAWENWALDFQIRTQIVFNQATPTSQDQTFRWQSPRVGISGKLLHGDDWSLSGAINTDLPYFLPSPLGGGMAATQNTQLLNPGMFASFSYQPKDSRWSVFSLVTPRFFIYSDNEAMDPQAKSQGLSWEAKNHFLISLSPTVNYALTEKTSLRLGTTVSYRKLLGSSWNPFNATTNWGKRNTDSWHLWQMPVMLGVNHAFNKNISIFPFIQMYPITSQRESLSNNQTASLLSSASVGMWISGTIL